MIRKLLIKMVIMTFALSPLAAAQAPRGGVAGNSESTRALPDLPSQVIPGNNLAPSKSGSEPAVSRQQALNIAQDRFQGRVLSVRIVDNDWRIRVDQNGTVFNVFVNGRSGEVSREID